MVVLFEYFFLNIGSCSTYLFTYLQLVLCKKTLGILIYCLLTYPVLNYQARLKKYVPRIRRHCRYLGTVYIAILSQCDMGHARYGLVKIWTCAFYVFYANIIPIQLPLPCPYNILVPFVHDSIHMVSNWYYSRYSVGTSKIKTSVTLAAVCVFEFQTRIKKTEDGRFQKIKIREHKSSPYKDVGFKQQRRQSQNMLIVMRPRFQMALVITIVINRHYVPAAIIKRNNSVNRYLTKNK